MFKNKGQAAVEFLTTYGWALAIILVMIAAMSFFGVTNPDRFASERCIAPSGFVYEDFQIRRTSNSGTNGLNIVELRFRNDLGYEISVIDNIFFEEAPIYKDSGAIIPRMDLSPGGQNSFIVYKGTMNPPNPNALFGRNLFAMNAAFNTQNYDELALRQNDLEKIYVNIHYFRTDSGINFNRVATFEIIGTVR